ncbi:FKBP-type peptidyl-prolyl cis-trans isomerase [Nocardioides dongxiaopingii]|uniref:FKBP-type peptidyl-prolyl cis-trans isomerase n=1 Tax=Nocardioides dongxiaopingii TaxID=2576036 RepID=UPI0010C762BB|nr:FKBP-type peptidyl-prolyl cis-trans isomerase [Nocardioides dongxiaopingii]
MSHTADRSRRVLRVVAAPALVLSLALSLTACGGDDDEDQTASDTTGETSGDWAPAIETNEEGDVTGLDFSGTAEPGDELEVRVVEEGDGAEVTAGQTIQADYWGQGYGTEEPFDESYSREPFTAQIGVGQLIQGWDQGLVGVPVGSRVLLAIPPDLGYGDQDQPGIPGGSTLYFVLDILSAA